MKKLGVMAAVAAFAIFAVLEFIQIFTTDDRIGYFSQEPSRLLWVAGIAISGGLLAWGFYRFPPRAQRHVRTLGLGAAAITATIALAYFGFGFFSLAFWASRNGGSFWSPLSMFLPVILMLLAVAAFSWIACWRIWRKRASQ